MIDIQSTLAQNIKNGVLTLNYAAFPGIIQEAILYFLNGINISLGEGVYLKVQGEVPQLKLEMAAVSFEGTAGPDGATLKIAGAGNYSDASVTVTFSKNDEGVVIALDAEMGSSLSWPISQVWPGILDKAPFTALALSDGKLTLDVNSSGEVAFTGTGSLKYDDTTLVSTVIRVLHNGNGTTSDDSTGTGVLFGISLPEWNAGEIWTQLQGLTFDNSGLLFSSLEEADSATLGDLGLIDPSQVPSIVTGDFVVNNGMTFFTTLQMEQALAPLAALLGDNQTLALYANTDTDNNVSLLAKFGTGSFKPFDTAAFEFEGFELEWKTGGSGTAINASASGAFYPSGNDDAGIELKLTGTFDPGAGAISLTFTMDDWEQPFGYQQLVVKELLAAVSLGGAAEGVTIELSGDFDFTANENGSTQSFEFGVGASIADFEIPTGIGFVLKGDNDQSITLSTIINGITSINADGVPFIQFIDSIFQLKNLVFAVVESGSLQIGARTFEEGFTLQADFDIFSEEVNLDVTITEKGGSTDFSGLATLTSPVVFGNVMTISGSTSSGEPTSTGPEMAVSSNGIVVGGVNNNEPVYFFVSAYLELLDIVKADLYGIAAKDNLFSFLFATSTVAPPGGNGNWAGDFVDISVDPKQYIFDASFGFDFQWSSVTIGPLTILGEELIPEKTLGDVSLSAGLAINVNAGSDNPSFLLEGGLSFVLFGLSLNYGSSTDLKTIVSINLKDAPPKLSDIKDVIWDWVKSHIESLLDDSLKDFDAFKNWVEQEKSELMLDADKVAAILKDTFNKAADDVADFLKAVGYSASEIKDALVNVLHKTAEEAEDIVNSIFTKAKGCALTTATFI